MKETTHYKLKKIELNDSPPDITVINENWDTIDEELKERDTRVGLLSALTTKIKTSVVNALNGLQQDLDAHSADGVHIGKNAAVRVFHSVNQSIPNNTNTILAFDSERYDTNEMHSTTVNNSRITCKTAGKYLIIASVLFDANTDGRRVVRIKVNSHTIIENVSLPLGDSGGSNMTASTVYELNENDYVEVEVLQTSGISLNIVANSRYSPEFMMVRVG